jgi:hypothetical protein
MTRIIKKYTILIVALIVLARLLTASILFIWPDLLTIRESEISVRIIGSEYLEYSFGIYTIQRNVKRESSINSNLDFDIFFKFTWSNILITNNSFQ